MKEEGIKYRKRGINKEFKFMLQWHLTFFEGESGIEVHNHLVSE